MSIQSNFYSEVWAPLSEKQQAKIQPRHDQLHQCYLVMVDAEQNNPHMVDTAAKKFFECYNAFVQDFSENTHFPAVANHIKIWNERTTKIQEKALKTLNNKKD